MTTDIPADVMAAAINISIDARNRGDGSLPVGGLPGTVLIARAIMAERERCAAVVAKHDKTGREWIRGSLWDKISNEAAGRIRSGEQP